MSDDNTNDPYDLRLQRDRARETRDIWKKATENALSDGDKARDALVALLDYLDSTNTEAGFVWDEVDRIEYLTMGGVLTGKNT